MTRRIWLDPPTGGRLNSARRIDVEPGRHFTTVRLDRDDYVYQARKEGRIADAELRPGFAEAAGRLMATACDHLWVQGYPGGFAYSSGPSIVTLFVPFPLADQAAEALRAAEMDGDLTRLDALTQTLTIPLDTWLAPGERELRRGVDFTATPSAFLTFLRAKAQARGLRLNGRPIPGAVWVRPQMPQLNQDLRTQYPDTYGQYADPTPYTAHRDPDDAPFRPYVGARTLDPVHEATPVVFMDTPARSRRSDGCPCGFAGAPGEVDDSRHAQAHMRWSVGVPVPRNLAWYGGNIAVVTATSPVGWRKLAYQCALLPKRENGYDFASFAVGEGESSETNERAYLYRSDGRVVGFVSAYDTSDARWHSFETSQPATQPTDGVRRPAVNVIFTSDTWRRHGIGRDLVEAIAKDAGIAVTDVAWTTPFSAAGRALAKSIDPDGAWLA